jgi:hypothetical protein
MANQQLDWIHPSVRDVVIEYLMNHDVERQRFLQTAAPSGLVLALSSAGGRKGERSLPFLKHDRDWDALRTRYLQLAVELGADEQLALIRGLLSPLRQPGQIVSDAERDRMRTIAGQALEEIRRSWDTRRERVSVRTIRAYYDLSVSALIYVASPQLDSSWNSAVADLRLAISSEELWSDLSAPSLLLELAEVLTENEPRYVRVVGWPLAAKSLFEAVLGVIEERSSSLRHLQPVDDEWVDLGDDQSVRVPVEPSSDEQDETEWLEAAFEVLRRVSTIGMLEQRFIEPLESTCSEHLEVRHKRQRRWNEEGSKVRDDDDYKSPRSQGAGDFDLDDFFADL